MRNILLLSLVMFLPAMLFAQASAVSKNNQGNKAFKKGKFAEAADLYKKAELEAPEKKEIAYNLGNTYYRQGDFESARKAYEKARTIPDKKLRRKALFNMGNSFFQSGAAAQDESGQKMLEQAAKAYEEVLKSDPTDYPAKFNLEKALVKMEEKKQQQQNQQDKNGKPPEPSDYAKKMKTLADAEVNKRNYKGAFQIMNDLFQKDKTAPAYADFFQRLKDVNEVNP